MNKARRQLSPGGPYPIYHSLFLVRRISSDIEHCLTVYLESDRPVECDLDPMACLYLNVLLVIYMLALEDGREDCKCRDLS